jgi:hypothetical protein
MSSLGGYYLNPHVTQFDGSTYAGSNCTPTAGANGANAATGGDTALLGWQVRNLVKRNEETDPTKPGWSIPDLDLAMARAGVPFENRSQRGWSALLADVTAGHYLVLQGDSDRFSNMTCSGAFDGFHAIGIHPARRVWNARPQHWIDDPICRTGRWEFDSTLKAYGAKLDPDMRYGMFGVVPRASAPPPEVKMGLQFRIMNRIDGIVTVVGNDHAIIRVDNAGFVAVPAGQKREVAAKVLLTAPVPNHPNIGAGTQAYLIGNIPGANPDVSIAAILLLKDGTFTPS